MIERAKLFQEDLSNPIHARLQELGRKLVIFLTGFLIGLGLGYAWHYLATRVV